MIQNSIVHGHDTSISKSISQVISVIFYSKIDWLKRTREIRTRTNLKSKRPKKLPADPDVDAATKFNRNANKQMLIETIFETKSKYFDEK